MLGEEVFRTRRGCRGRAVRAARLPGIPFRESRGRGCGAARWPPRLRHRSHPREAVWPWLTVGSFAHRAQSFYEFLHKYVRNVRSKAFFGAELGGISGHLSMLSMRLRRARRVRRSFLSAACLRIVSMSSWRPSARPAWMAARIWAASPGMGG